MKQCLNMMADCNVNGTRLFWLYAQRGFTLIEMMVVITIMGIILALAAPNYKIFVMNNLQATAMNEFIGFLNFARSEATKRGSIVRICRSSNGSSCSGTGVQWEDGWMVYQDIDDDDVRDAAEPILKVRAALDDSLEMRGNGNAVSRVRFNSRGFAPGYAASFTFCDGRGDAAVKSLSIAITGRVSKGSESACL